MNPVDRAVCEHYGLSPDIPTTTTFKDVPCAGSRLSIEECKRIIKRAIQRTNRPLYSDPQYSFAIDPENAKELDDCIAIAIEDGKPTLLINITDPTFILNNLPAFIKNFEMRSASKRASARYMPSGTMRLWLGELLHHQLIGFPRYDREGLAKLIAKGDPDIRVPCLTMKIHYNKRTGRLDFNSARIRFTTIVPPYCYSYADANDMFFADTVGGATCDSKLKELLHDLDIIAKKNAIDIPHNTSNHTGFLVSIAMNIANITGARIIGDYGIWCIYRSCYDPHTQSQVSKYCDDPVTQLNEYSHPEIAKYGYIRWTSPARRFEDFVNINNTEAYFIGTCAPIVGEELDNCIDNTSAADNEIWWTKRYLHNYRNN